MLLMIDNYDSFTYNVVQVFRELGVEVVVAKNDALSVADVRRLAPTHIVISPGPGTPSESGISIPVIETFSGEVPILGVCLGHQCIGEVFGAKVIKASSVMHGKTSTIHHMGEGVFKGIAGAFEATRYHSLVLDSKSITESLRVTAWTESSEGARQEIMGVKHPQMRVEGVQFHPESILSENGHAILENFLRL